MPKLKKHIALGVLALATTLLTGCASVNVENITPSGVPAIIKLKVPDSTGYEVIKLEPGDIVVIDSVVGGAYSLIVLPDQDYLKLADNARDKLETSAILNATTTDPNDMLAILDILKGMQTTIDKMKSGSAACAAHLGDYESAYASVGWDQLNKQWTASCGSGVSNGTPL